MKKIILIFAFLLTFSCMKIDTFANEILSSNENQIYEEFVDKSMKFDTMNLLSDSVKEDKSEHLGKIIDKIYCAVFDEVKASLNALLSILLVCVLASVLKAFVNKTYLSDVADYGIYCVCGTIVIAIFKMINDICVTSIDNLSDFMDIAVPTYATVLTGCGYAAMAVSMQSIFMIISIFITHLIKDMLCPLLFCCGLISVVGGISKVIDLSKLINLISKTIKYILGIIMTVFAGVIIFSGFSATANDSLAVQTAKFAIANFVPVVGGCLSSALNGLKQSSVLLKNNMGYAGFLVLLSLCIVPVFKIALSVFSLRLSSSIVHLFAEPKLGSMLDSVCEVLVTLGALVVFVSVIFVLIIGVISSVG